MRDRQASPDPDELSHFAEEASDGIPSSIPAFGDRVHKQSFVRYPLTTLLSGEANVRILRELCARSEGVSAVDLAQHLGMAANGVRRSLGVLVASDGARVIDHDGERTFGPGDHPLMTELAALFAAENAAYDARRTAIVMILEADPHIVAAWHYGSIAKGNDDALSDVQTIVVVQDDFVTQVSTSLLETIGKASPSFVRHLSLHVVGMRDLIALSDHRELWRTIVTDVVMLKGERPRQLLTEATDQAGGDPTRAPSAGADLTIWERVAKKPKPVRRSSFERYKPV